MANITSKVVDNQTLFTIRNTKGNELTVSNFGASVVSFRFRDKSFQNKFIINRSCVLVDNQISNSIWHADSTIEGVKFSLDNSQIIYSISNDNEISIRYFSDSDISAKLFFSSVAFPNPQISPYAANKSVSSAKEAFNIIDKPAEVLMEIGMFGYDPGCPIDYLESGLKNAADISSASGIDVKVYATQNQLIVEHLSDGVAFYTSNQASGKTSSQTVYVFKNRK